MIDEIRKCGKKNPGPTGQKSECYSALSDLALAIEAFNAGDWVWQGIHKTIDVNGTEYIKRGGCKHKKPGCTSFVYNDFTGTDETADRYLVAPGGHTEKVSDKDWWRKEEVWSVNGAWSEARDVCGF